MLAKTMPSQLATKEISARRALYLQDPFREWKYLDGARQQISLHLSGQKHRLLHRESPAPDFSAIRG